MHVVNSSCDSIMLAIYSILYVNIHYDENIHHGIMWQSSNRMNTRMRNIIHTQINEVWFKYFNTMYASFMITATI